MGSQETEEAPKAPAKKKRGSPAVSGLATSVVPKRSRSVHAKPAAPSDGRFALLCPDRSSHVNLASLLQPGEGHVDGWGMVGPSPALDSFDFAPPPACAAADAATEATLMGERSAKLREPAGWSLDDDADWPFSLDDLDCLDGLELTLDAGNLPSFLLAF
jgi:hypothetical protein